MNKTRNYFLEKIEQNELSSIRPKKDCTTLNYIENVLILASTITRRIFKFLLLLL